MRKINEWFDICTDTDTACRWGNTPLDESRMSGNKNVIRLLEEAKSTQLLEFPLQSQEITGSLANS